MKITGLKTYLVPPRWLFLKIETDDGVVGWGEPVLEGRAATLAALIEEMSDFLIGRDPRAINDIWQMLYRNGCYRGGPVLMSAIAGIDMALWDILGKLHGAPAHALLGGKQRDRIKTYIWIGGDRPANLVAEAIAARARGFSAVKMNVCEELALIDNYKKVDEIVRRLTELREAVGRLARSRLRFSWPRPLADGARPAQGDRAPPADVRRGRRDAAEYRERWPSFRRRLRSRLRSASACIRAANSRLCSKRARRSSSIPIPPTSAA